MAKEIKSIIKLHVTGGQANPAPPVGPALGQHGVNIMEFCKSFNEKTKDKPGLVIPVVISVYKDARFSLFFFLSSLISALTTSSRSPSRASSKR